MRIIISIILFLMAIPAVHSNSVETDDSAVSSADSWWSEVGNNNGIRLFAKIGGWNFWYNNDKEHIYSDLTGSIFTGKESRLHNYPMFGLTFRWAPWKFILVNAVVSTTRLSIGTGFGFPVAINNNTGITPWAVVDWSYTNHSFKAFTIEGGIDVFYKRFIIGLEFGYTGNGIFDKDKSWVSIDYGLYFGVKIK